MRVTSNNVSESLIAQLQKLATRQVGLQGKVASGQRVTDASDDPFAAQQVLGLRDDAVNLAQYRKNIQTNQEFAGATQGVISSLQKIVDRAQEIAVSVDSLDSAGDMKSYATEVSELIKQAVQVANTKQRGEYLLGGTKTDAPAFVAATDANGRITAVNFQGNTSQARSEIAPGVEVASRVPGANSTGSGERGLLADSRYGADLFAHLITLRDQLEAGDASGVMNSTRALLQKDEENVLYHVANNGALQSQLDSTLSANKREKLNVESSISDRTDIDMAEAIVKLNQQQTSYQAALQSAGSILNLSLLSYLR
jgi:flagellar hook-associated protein 3 FlgL